MLSYKMIITFTVSVLFVAACSEKKNSVTGADPRQEINALLDSFNVAAGRADFNTYFSYYADSAVFCGTDATERWDKDSFMKWAKPYFDRGRAWNFTAFDRHIFVAATGDYAWFDELLSTQMKICRGSGVLQRKDDQWKITQYILSTTVPNNIVDSVTRMKTAEEDSLLKVFKMK